ncbi:MAG: hypothetical protein ACRD5H_14505, partial [Nitrososphaerales archaeon]
AALIDMAERIDRLWDPVELTVDGTKRKLDNKSDIVETDRFDVTIPDKDIDGKDHPYISYYGHLGVRPGGPIKMVTVARVAILVPPGNPPLDGSKSLHVIRFYSKSLGDPSIGDIAYEVDVQYNVTFE